VREHYEGNHGLSIFIREEAGSIHSSIEGVDGKKSGRTRQKRGLRNRWREVVAGLGGVLLSFLKSLGSRRGEKSRAFMGDGDESARGEVLLGKFSGGAF